MTACDRQVGIGSGPLWTHETLRQHLLAVMDERDRRYEDRFVTQSHAVELAKAELQRRLELLNEFKELAAAKDDTFITKDVLERIEQSIGERLKKLESRGDISEGARTGRYAMWLWFSIGFTIAGALFAFAARAIKL